MKSQWLNSKKPILQMLSNLSKCKGYIKLIVLIDQETFGNLKSMLGSKVILYCCRFFQGLSEY